MEAATLERMKSFTSEERLREVRRKMEELRRQNELERKKLQALLQQHEEELFMQEMAEGNVKWIESASGSEDRSATPTIQQSSSAAFIGTRGPAKSGSPAAGSPVMGTPPFMKADVTSGADKFKQNMLAPVSRGSAANSPAPSSPPMATKGFSPLVPRSSPLARSESNLTGSNGHNNALSTSGGSNGAAANNSGLATPPSATSPPDSPSLASHDEKRAQRAHVILEIINTESAYIDFITVWIDEYMKPLQRDATITKDDFTLIFSNIDQLLPINIELYKQMKELQLGAAEVYDVQLGDLFARSADLFKIYTLYFTNNATAAQAVDRLVIENRLFQEFLEVQQFRNPRTKGLTFNMFMIMPIQRLCKYPLLLRNLIKATPESHPDYQPLLRAIDAIERIVTFLNEKKRDREALQKVVDVCRSLEGVDEAQFILPTRRHIMDQSLGLLSNKQVKKRHVYLFNDLIVVTKLKPASNPPRYLCKTQHSLSALRVIDIADRDGFCYLFGIAPKDNMDPAAQTSFLCSSPEEKEKWLGTLKKLIRDFQIKLMAEKQKNAVFPLDVLKATASSSSTSSSNSSTNLPRVGSPMLSPNRAGKLF